METTPNLAIELLLKKMRIVHAAMLISILLYAVIATLVPASAIAPPRIGSAVTLLAAITVGAVFLLRSALLRPAEHALAVEPASSKASIRWQTAYLILFALSEVVALYGLILHFLGFPLSNSLPFFVFGLALLALFTPSLPRPE